MRKIRKDKIPHLPLIYLRDSNQIHTHISYLSHRIVSFFIDRTEETARRVEELDGNV
jgi:hypothetical protein